MPYRVRNVIRLILNATVSPHGRVASTAIVLQKSCSEEAPYATSLALDSITDHQIEEIQ